MAGYSAAAWYGAPFAAAHDRVTVVRPPHAEWKGPSGVRVHRCRGPVEAVLDDDGVPVTSALQTAWDVAALESLGTAVAALDAMVRTSAIDVPRLTSVVQSSSGRWGVTRVRRAVQLIDPRAESPPESRVRVALVLAGLSPVPQYEIEVEGRVVHVDLAFPEARVAVEYEGAYHFEDDQIARDDARYARLRAAGWTVIRFSASDLRDLDAVVIRVRAALRQKWPFLP